MKARLLNTLPAPVRNDLDELGLALRRARIARNESQRALAQRLGVDVRTLRQAEKGDPTVSAGILMSALWSVGLGPLSTPISQQAMRATAAHGNERARRKVLDGF